MQFLILLVIHHDFLQRREESISQRLFTESNSRDLLRCVFLRSIVADVGMVLRITHFVFVLWITQFVFVLKLLDLTMEALVLLFEVVVDLY